MVSTRAIQLGRSGTSWTLAMEAHLGYGQDANSKAAASRCALVQKATSGSNSRRPPDRDAAVERIARPDWRGADRRRFALGHLDDDRVAGQDGAQTAGIEAFADAAAIGIVMVDRYRLLRITTPAVMLTFILMVRFGRTMVVMTARVRGPRPIGARLQMRCLLIARSDQTETARRISIRASNVHPSREVAQQQRRQGQANDRRTDGFQLSVPNSKMNGFEDDAIGKSLTRVEAGGPTRADIIFRPIRPVNPNRSEDSMNIVSHGRN